eukprot:2530961-Pyramimonas_sp.AAC.1
METSLGVCVVNACAHTLNSSTWECTSTFCAVCEACWLCDKNSSACCRMCAVLLSIMAVESERISSAYSRCRSRVAAQSKCDGSKMSIERLVSGCAPATQVTHWTRDRVLKMHGSPFRWHIGGSQVQLIVRT